MLNRIPLMTFPSLCLTVLTVSLTATTTEAQVSQQTFCPAQAPCPQCAHPPCQTYAQKLCHPYRCCECCAPNFTYWGHWPTTWRRWPQRRPDISFPQGLGKEVLPTPQGTQPQQLPKEQPLLPPTAPGESVLPPVGEGPATGPGEPDVPFDFDQGFDSGPGFDQGLPGMENLPSEPFKPESLPIKGTEESDAPILPTMPSALEPSATEAPAPNTGSANESNEDSHLSQQVQVPATDAGLDHKIQPPLEEMRPPEQIVLNPCADQESCVAPTAADELLSRVSVHKYGDDSPNPYEPRLSQPEDVICRTTFESAELVSSGSKSCATLNKQAAALTDGTTVAPLPDTAIAPLPETAIAPLPETTVAPLPEIRAAGEELDSSCSDTAVEEETSMTEPGSAPAPQARKPLSDAKQMPVGLDGFCPVELIHSESWTLGNAHYAVEFEGRTYMMSGPEQHRAFRSHPERYAPVNRGFDPVLSLEQNKDIEGRTDACAVFEDRLYMFAGPESLALFQSNPKCYAKQPLHTHR